MVSKHDESIIRTTNKARYMLVPFDCRRKQEHEDIIVSDVKRQSFHYDDLPVTEAISREKKKLFRV